MIGRIAFDAAPAIARPTGVGVYVRDLGIALTRLAPDRIALIGVREDGPLAESALTSIGQTWFPRRSVPLWLQRRADRDAREVGADLVHYSNMYAPILGRVPFVLTIQDLSVIRHPRYHPIGRVGMAPVMALAVHRAKAVIVPSEATRQELVKLLRVPSSKVHIVPLAPAANPPAVGEEEAQAVLARLGLASRQFALSVGTLEPRKNHLSLVRAFEGLTPGGPFDRLVLAGGEGWRTSRLREAIRQSPAQDRIVVTGYVSDRERQALLQHCSVFAYLSIYEGYGLPVVEAMASGAPVVTTKVSSLPEAAGGAALLVDPHDIAGIRAALERAWSARDELIAAGLARSQAWTWDDVGRGTLEVYDSCLARLGRGRRRAPWRRAA
jgi:alpha-1,3-rhamnosyl/mannosyltransferase